MSSPTAVESSVPPGHDGSGQRQSTVNGRGRRKLADLAVIATPAFLALGLCLYELTTRSLWLDEAATVAIASQHGAALGNAIAHDGGNMLAYYGLLHVLIGLFGKGAFVLRFPAAIATALTAGLVAQLALRLHGRRVAALAGVLAAVSLSLVYWGQNARGYTAMIACIVASFVALLSLLGNPRSRGAWAAYVITTTAAIYFGLEAVLVVPAQLLALVWFRDRRRALVSAVAVVAACCIPLAVLAADRGSGQLFWVPAPSFTVFKQIVQALASAGIQPTFYTSTTTALVAVTLIVLVLGSVRALAGLRRRSDPTAWPPALVLAWLLVPAVLALTESLLGQSIFQARYLLVSLPAVSLLLAWTLGHGSQNGVEHRSERRRIAQLAMPAAGVALIVLRVLQLAPAYGVSTENWRSATSSIVADAAPSDCIAFYPADGRMAFRYYLRDPTRAPRPVLPTLAWSRAQPFVEDYATLSEGEVARLRSDCPRVWLVARRGGGAGGTAESRANVVRFKRLQAALASEYARSRAEAFGQAGLLTATVYSR